MSSWRTATATRVVDSQNGNRRPADRSQPEKFRSIPLEVFRPRVFSRVEEADDLSGGAVNARDVWPFSLVTSQAGICQVFEDCRTAMLLGDDVVDLEGDSMEDLRQEAVFTQAVRPVAHLLFEGLVHTDQGWETPF